jgi:hypothetical protein
MSRLPSPFRSLGLLIGLAAPLAACGDSEPPSGGGGAVSNRAQFTFDCDLNGLNGVLTMVVEVVNTTGVVFGGGANPEITGVIGTGSVSYLTAGDLRSSTAYYTFTGRDGFADFVEPATSAAFLVQWVINGQQLNMIINPFGPGPTQHACVQTSAMFLPPAP